MAFNAMTQDSDSQNPLSYAPDERPALSLTPLAYGSLQEELTEARRAWLHHRIPQKHGARRTAALAKDARLKARYELLLGHSVGADEQQTYIDINEPL